MTDIRDKYVEIIHPFTRETKSFLIEAVFPSHIAIRWELAGVYDIYLKTGQMIARSIKARKKGPCLWVAKDLQALKEMVAEHYAMVDKRQREIDFDTHVGSMPK